jgi:hypothetical protein
MPFVNVTEGMAMVRAAAQLAGATRLIGNPNISVGVECGIISETAALHGFVGKDC